MRASLILAALGAACATVAACGTGQSDRASQSDTSGRADTTAQASTASGRERHLANVRQLTTGGENAEAYFSPDGTRLIFQSTREGVPCDQIFTMKIDGTDLRRVSTGDGR